MQPGVEPVSAAEIREMDRTAIQEFGVPGVVLMENAGAGAAVVLRAAFPEAATVGILAGKGNNGGDAFVVARHLLNRGLDVRCVFAGDLDDVDPASDAGINLFILLKTGLVVKEVREAADVEAAGNLFAGVDCLVDGLLGTGTRGRIREPFASLIETANGMPVPVLALDLPSGLDADTGETLGPCIRATHTATFVRPKKGFRRAAGPERCGTVHVIDIGMPAVIVDLVLQKMRRQPDPEPEPDPRTPPDN